MITLNKRSLLIELLFVLKLSVTVLCLSFTDSRTSCSMISRARDDRTDPDVDDENPSLRGSDVQPANCSNVNNQLSTQDVVIGMYIRILLTLTRITILCYVIRNCVRELLSHSPALDVR